MTQFIYSPEEVQKKLLKEHILLSEQDKLQAFMEQYKMLVEHAHKINERIEACNQFFITANSFIFSLIGFFLREVPLHGRGLLLNAVLICLGITISTSWLRVINSYRKSSTGTYQIINCFEDIMPTTAFSFKLRMESLVEHPKYRNIVAYIESAIPKIFMIGYLAYALACASNYGSLR